MDQKNKQAPCVPQIAVGAVIIRKKKVLLVLRAHEPAKGQWAIPGGKVEAGETLHEALKREIREETGLEIEVGTVAHVFDLIERSANNRLIRHYVIIDYKARICGGKPMAGDDARELCWFSKKALKEAPVSIKTRDLLTLKYGF